MSQTFTNTSSELAERKLNFSLEDILQYYMEQGGCVAGDYTVSMDFEIRRVSNNALIYTYDMSFYVDQSASVTNESKMVLKEVELSDISGLLANIDYEMTITVLTGIVSNEI